jgi:hypothetical protein
VVIFVIVYTIDDMNHMSGSPTKEHLWGAEFSAVNFRHCSLQATMSSGSMRAYVLEPSGPGGHLLIHSVQADGVIHLQHPNSYFLQSWWVTARHITFKHSKALFSVLLL